MRLEEQLNAADPTAAPPGDISLTGVYSGSPISPGSATYGVKRRFMARDPRNGRLGAPTINERSTGYWLVTLQTPGGVTRITRAEFVSARAQAEHGTRLGKAPGIVLAPAQVDAVIASLTSGVSHRVATTEPGATTVQCDDIRYRDTIPCRLMTGATPGTGGGFSSIIGTLRRGAKNAEGVPTAPIGQTRSPPVQQPLRH